MMMGYWYVIVMSEEMFHERELDIIVDANGDY